MILESSNIVDSNAPLGLYASDVNEKGLVNFKYFKWCVFSIFNYLDDGYCSTPEPHSSVDNLILDFSNIDIPATIGDWAALSEGMF